MSQVLPQSMLTHHAVGSSIGNFTRPEAVQFVRRFADLLSDRDSFLIGLDACQDNDKVTLAYNDKKDITARFTINGLQHANNLLGKEVFKLEDWTAFGKYNAALGAHQAFVSPKVDVEVLGVAVARNEWVQIEESYKYSPTQANKLWQQAGVVESVRWPNDAGDYGRFCLSLKPTLTRTSRSTHDQTSKQDVCLTTTSIRTTSSAKSRRMAGPVEGLGHCNPADDTQRRAEVEADQASKCMHLLSWPHTDIPRHEAQPRSRSTSDRAEILSLDLRARYRPGR